jgi:hypothetical protein
MRFKVTSNGIPFVVIGLGVAIVVSFCIMVGVGIGDDAWLVPSWCLGFGFPTAPRLDSLTILGCQHLLDVDRDSIRHCGGRISLYHVAFTIDQELREIPFDGLRAQDAGFF